MSKNKRHNTGKPPVAAVVPASLDDYLDPDGRQYAPRQHPYRLNWGDRMNMDQLNIAGKAANRYPIKGDWDYIEPGK